ncbi:MAG: hypothetical protein IKK28_00465, partial [Mogibacterium sp.]|nr:hypothetical protein [Mogibacterium sp.]
FPYLRIGFKNQVFSLAIDAPPITVYSHQPAIAACMDNRRISAESMTIHNYYTLFLQEPTIDIFYNACRENGVP